MEEGQARSEMKSLIFSRKPQKSPALPDREDYYFGLVF